MAYSSVTVPARWARRFTDPTLDDVETHFLLVPAAEVPSTLPLEANPREANVNRPIYRSVRNSLNESDDSVAGTFHLKHRGITIVADSVNKRRAVTREDGLDEYEIRFANGLQGVADGGHSYQIIKDALAADTIPDGQFVKLEVITGLPETVVVDIVGGRNTSLQVQDKSLLDLRDEFEFLKNELARSNWDGLVAWHENQNGVVDVVDVMAILACFDIETYPDRTKHPVDAYRRKRTVLDRFQSDPDRFRRLTPIIRDALRLHDWIALDSEAKWQAMGGMSGKGGKYGALEMVDSRDDDKEPFEFAFLDGEQSNRRLRRPAVLPILAAFRQEIELDTADELVGTYPPVRWKGGFDSVLGLWDEAGGQLLRTFYEHWDSTGRDLHAAGRSPALWGSLYKELTVAQLDL